MSEKIHKWTKYLLLIFVFVSIGFTLGKEFTRRSMNEKLQRQDATAPGSEAKADRKIMVYYMHATFRCATCNRIEELSRQLVENEFAEEIRNGTIEFRDVDYQKEEDVADKYEVSTGCLIVSEIDDGKVKSFDVLGDVWELYSDPPKFNEYVGGAIRKYLGE